MLVSQSRSVLFLFSLVPMPCTYMKAMATRLVQCILQKQPFRLSDLGWFQYVYTCIGMDIANGSSSNNASNALASLASLHQLMSFSLVPMSCTYMKAMATRLVQCILQKQPFRLSDLGWFQYVYTCIGMDIANGSSSNNSSNALASLASLHQLMS